MNDTPQQEASETSDQEGSDKQYIKEFIDSLDPDELKYACDYTDSKLGEGAYQKPEVTMDDFRNAME